MKKLIILFLLTSVLSAQSDKTSGYSFLTIGNSARETALSDFGIVGGDKITNVVYNPAILASLKNEQLYFTHNSWFSDVSAQSIGANFFLFDLPFAVNINNTSISDIEIRTKPGESYSKFDARYFYFAFSTSFDLIEELNLGVSAKYIYENILSDESSGYAADFGLIYKNIFENLNIGLSLRNIGSVSKLRNESSKLPLDFRLGVSYPIMFPSIESSLLMLGGIQKYLNLDGTHLHLGMEFSYDKLVSIRVGYLSGFESRGISIGTGISWGSAELDYSFTPTNYGLGNSNTITILYNF